MTGDLIFDGIIMALGLVIFFIGACTGMIVGIKVGQAEMTREMNGGFMPQRKEMP